VPGRVVQIKACSEAAAVTLEDLDAGAPDESEMVSNNGTRAGTGFSRVKSTFCSQ